MQSLVLDTVGNTNKRRQGPDFLQVPVWERQKVHIKPLGKSQLVLDVQSKV